MLSKYNLLFYSMGLLLFAMCMAPSNVLAKQLYWGDLHVHTSFSSDAYLFGNQRAGPVEAYAFAMKRQAITLADGRQVMIGRPLDFMAVTDHAEYFDLMNMCLVPATPQYGTPYCSQFRAVAGNAQSNPTAGFQAITSPSYFLRHGQFCINNPGICPVAADTTWQRIQTAANLANLQPDFTAFIAQEWSGANPGVLLPGAQNRITLHRNIIYANRNVPAPIDFIRYKKLAEMWAALYAGCTDFEFGDGPPCDALAIPHNSNLSMGKSFNLSYQNQSQNEWELRARYEKLVEIFQGKGNSECLNDDPADNNPDCTFELKFEEPVLPAVPPAVSSAMWQQLRDGYVRTALAKGLKYYVDNNLQFNPLKMGFIGSTDTHNSTGGNVKESTPTGNHGYVDNTPLKRLSGQLANNPGGLVAVWADVNTRQSIFNALKTREVYATSGPRITVKFYQTWDTQNLCNGVPGANWVPMGGDITSPPPTPGAIPKFVVIAAMDQTRLAKIDIIKVGLDAAGNTHEKVHSMDAVDPAIGDATMCFAVGDNNFTPITPVLWYARVLEMPTKRWSKVDCESVMGSCDDYPETHKLPAADKYIQERAWTSPIWQLPPAALVQQAQP